MLAYDRGPTTPPLLEETIGASLERITSARIGGFPKSQRLPPPHTIAARPRRPREPTARASSPRSAGRSVTH